MNREPNKEIDILLRKLSRKQNGDFAADASSGGMAEAHLDADELNAYAEQALPEALRARYTEHVADCGRCRSIVTQLSLVVVSCCFAQRCRSACSVARKDIPGEFVFAVGNSLCNTRHGRDHGRCDCLDSCEASRKPARPCSERSGKTSRASRFVARECAGC